MPVHGPADHRGDSEQRNMLLNAEYTASVADYEVIHTHIVMMADRLSDGIIAQFPSRFR